VLASEPLKECVEVYRITGRKVLAEKVYEIWVEAPHIARHARGGQFVIVRTGEGGERIPLTISAVRGGEIRIIFMAVGKTTHLLASLREGGTIHDIAGPLGRPSDTRTHGTCVLVGGGVGTASLPLIADELVRAKNRVITIIGARNASLLLLEEELAGISDELIIATDDGSRGFHGFAADVLKIVLAREKVDCVWIIGPAIMMKITSNATRDLGIRTYVSLNPIMVDGTGMCGSCRVKVGGETRFACVDGPEFDAHQVDWDMLLQRQRMYIDEEREALEHYHHECSCRGGAA
jgi:ferredoxin--NADP+ reductase